MKSLRSPILRITPTSSLCGPIWSSAAWGECPCAHGAARSARPQSRGEPGLGDRTIRGLGDEYTERAYANAQANGGDTRTAELDAWLRQRLADEGVRPEHIEIEFERVMQVVFAV